MRKLLNLRRCKRIWKRVVSWNCQTNLPFLHFFDKIIVRSDSAVIDIVETLVHFFDYIKAVHHIFYSCRFRQGRNCFQCFLFDRCLHTEIPSLSKMLILNNYKASIYFLKKYSFKTTKDEFLLIS